MDETGIYKTIKAPSEGEYKEKGSKFLAFAHPVTTEDEFKEILADLKKRFYDARHHVYAFRIGADKRFYRCSDDGEPPNSSGPPVLGQILSFDLTNIAIIVVRYFGGTKLGVPGLINAYKSATSDAIQNAEIIEVTETKTVEIKFQYPAIGNVMRIINEEGLEVLDREMLTDCKFVLSIKVPDFDRVIEKIEDLRMCEITRVKS